MFARFAVHYTSCLFCVLIHASFVVLSMEAIKLFGVKAKCLLALECVLLCLVLTPTLNWTFNGLRLDLLLETSFEGE